MAARSSSPSVVLILLAVIATGVPFAASTAEPTDAWVIEDVVQVPDGMWTTGIAVDSQGNPHIAYSETRGGALAAPPWDTVITEASCSTPQSDRDSECNIIYAKKENEAWAFETVEGGILSSSWPAATLDLTLDDQDTPWIAYSHFYNTAATLAVRTGGLWQGMVIDHHRSFSTSVRIGLAACSTGGPAACFVTTQTDRATPDGPSSEIILGETWSGYWPGFLYLSLLSTSNAYGAKVAAQDGRWHVLYWDASGGLKYVSRVDPGWTIESLPIPCTEEYDLAIDADGNLHASSSFPALGLFYAERTDGAWAADTIDTTPHAGFRSNSIAVDAAGVPHVAYRGGDGSIGLRYASRTGDAWAIQVIDDDCFMPSLALDSSGRAHIAYWHGATLRYAHQVPSQGIGEDGPSLPTEEWVRVTPNPGTAGFGLEFALAESGPVEVRLYDVSGRSVARPFQGVLPAGVHRIPLDREGSDGRALDSGVYWVSLARSGGIRTTRMVSLQ
jgi:hypothetical protein